MNRRALSSTWSRCAGAALLFLAGCVPDTGREVVPVTLAAAGVDAPPFEVDGFTVTLERADVAFGPVDFCATESADLELCDAALFEDREPFVIDALDPAVVPVAAMEGTTGAVRTAFFDYGRSWYLTSSTPTSSPDLLEGHSAILEGAAERGEDVVRFVAAIDVTPITRGAVAVQGAKTEATVAGGETVVVRVDPRAWLAGVDFDALLAEVTDPAVPVALPPSGAAYQTIVLHMTSLAPAGFEWRAP
jgi:hypothetical protein